MHVLESILLAVVAAMLLSALYFGRQRPRLTLGLGALGASLAVLQAALEGARWQLVPLYFLLVLTALHAALALLLPVFQFDPPTGPHAVGTSTFEWTDESRQEVRSKDPAARRRLVVQLWYPAAPSSGAPPARYVDARVAGGMARALRLPGFVFKHLALVPTHATTDAPLAPSDAPFPVLLFSHGLGTYRNQSTFQVEELASHGYVVVGINHTYDAAFTLFRDGTGVPYDSAGDLGRLDTREKLLGARLRVWVEDALFVLNRLATLKDEDPRFAGRLDLARVGYLGHSFGGAAALSALAADPRLRAGLNMDGALFGDAAHARPPQPFMLMTGQPIQASRAQLALAGATRSEFEAFAAEVRQRWERAIAEAPGQRYRVEMESVHHLGFADVPLIAPLLFRGTTPRDVHRLLNDYTLAFFDTHLKGVPSPLLQGPAPRPEVKFTARPRPPGRASAALHRP